MPSQFVTVKMLGLTSRARFHCVWRDTIVSEGLVLDAGCGSGEYLLSLQLKGFDVVGVDRDTRQLRNILVVMKQVGRRCHLIAADLANTPFRSSTFVAVLCMEVINSVNNDEDALAELVRVLAKDGVCTISVPYEGYPAVYDPLNKLLRKMGSAPIHLGMWSSPTIRRLYKPRDILLRLRDLGLNPIKLTYVGKWLVPVLENYLALLFYYKVLAPRFGSRIALMNHRICSVLLSVISKAVELVIRLDEAANLHGTHFIIKARKASKAYSANRKAVNKGESTPMFQTRLPQVSLGKF